jgi:carbon-monoxide dehydrogenase small subunit
MSTPAANPPPSPEAPDAGSRLTYTLRINGADHEVRDAWYHEDLLRVLRHRLGLTGTKYGCEHGQCGACTVLVDDEPVNACLELAAGAVGCEITTIEGYNRDDGELTELQECFVRHGALQCGYCTPGFVMSAAAFVRDHPDATAEEVREGMDGNLCRCTGYGRIIAAVQETAASAGGPPSDTPVTVGGGHGR